MIAMSERWTFWTTLISYLTKHGPSKVGFYTNFQRKEGLSLISGISVSYEEHNFDISCDGKLYFDYRDLSVPVEGDISKVLDELVLAGHPVLASAALDISTLLVTNSFTTGPFQLNCLKYDAHISHCLGKHIHPLLKNGVTSSGYFNQEEYRKTFTHPSTDSCVVLPIHGDPDEEGPWGVAGLCDGNSSELLEDSLANIALWEFLRDLEDVYPQFHQELVAGFV